MAKCLSCGAELRFDIKTQKLICDHCGVSADPYEYDAKDAAQDEASAAYPVNVFTCPNCGGEIISTAESATEFCTYCGAQVMLEQRLDQAKRPDLILPFMKTRDDLKKCYRAKIRKAIFAPRDMKDPAAIDSFRGIYMPYWVYEIEKHGHAQENGSHSHTSGDTEYTDHFTVDFEIDASYKGIAFDASSSFEDDIGDSISPFDASKARPFTPSMISGFYADTADVPQDVYDEDARQLAAEDIHRRLDDRKELSSITLSDRDMVITGENISAKSALFPVWFMCYRKGGRVAYSVINGETGNMAMDMPIDPVRYILFSMLLAIPVYGILEICFMSSAPAMLVFATVLMQIGFLLYAWEIRKTCAKDAHAGDRGYEASVKKAEEDKAGKAPQKPVVENKKSRKKKKKEQVEEDSLRFRHKPDIWEVIVYAGIGIFLLFIALDIGLILSYLLLDCASALMAWFWLDEYGRKFDALMWLSVLMPLITLGILFWDPVSDNVYYTAAIVVIAAVLLQMKGVLRQYNMLSTRKLPQFNKKGGDNRA